MAEINMGQLCLTTLASLILDYTSVLLCLKKTFHLLLTVITLYCMQEHILLAKVQLLF